jgi:hypothetical protein
MTESQDLANQDRSKDVLVTPEHTLLLESTVQACGALHTYKAELLGDTDEIALLGEKSRNKLKDCIQEINELLQTMERWISDPKTLRVVSFNSGTYPDRSRSSLILQQSDKPYRLPNKDDNLARLQVEINSVIYTFPSGTTYREEANAQSLRGPGRNKANSAENAMIQAAGRATYEGILEYRAKYVYYDDLSRTARSDNGPAIKLQLLLGGGVVGQGVSYIGMTSHKSESPIILEQFPRQNFKAVQGALISEATGTVMRQRVQEPYPKDN